MDRTNARERTIRSAALLFREHGVDATGLRDVVEHAGAPRGSLQHYFPGGKEQLVTEAVGWIAERAARPLHRTLLEDPPPPARQVVNDLLDRFRELLDRTEFRAGCPIAAAVVDAAASSEAIAEAANEAFETWLSPLEQALRRGGLPRDRARRVALLVVSAVEGALLVSRVRRDLTALDALQAELDLLLAAAPPARPRRGGQRDTGRGRR